MRIWFAVAIATFTSFFTAPSEAQNCQQICNQVYSFARQSRGDWAYVQQLQQLSNACQSCQLSSRVRPQSSPPPSMPKWTPPVETEHERAVSREMSKVLESTGNWAMRGAVLPKGVPLSSGTVQMEVVKVPEGYEDPFAQRGPPTYSSTTPTTPSRPTGSIWDPNHQSNMQPPQSPGSASTSAGPPISYPPVAPCTGFNAPGSNVSPCGK